jgi:hypothetical protein
MGAALLESRIFHSVPGSALADPEQSSMIANNAEHRMRLAEGLSDRRKDQRGVDLWPDGEVRFGSDIVC